VQCLLSSNIYITQIHLQSRVSMYYRLPNTCILVGNTLFLPDVITLVSISFLSVSKVGCHYRLDVAESRYGNQIPPSPTIFERPFKIKNYICCKICVWYDRLGMANLCISFILVCLSAKSWSISIFLFRVNRKHNHGFSSGTF